MFRRLDPARIVETARRLAQRVAERFPDSGLRRVAEDLIVVCERSGHDLEWLGRPIWPVRAAVGILIALLAVVFVATLAAVFRLDPGTTMTEVIQAIDAGINELVFLGIAVFFLSGLEARRKRIRALKALHELRSMAHIVDMHQLTKDPERVTHPDGGTDTPSSPARQLDRFHLARYLDYCSEMLSLLSKSAALYVQDFNDQATLAAVNEVEELTNGLSRKIWQKIMMLDRELPGAAMIRVESLHRYPLKSGRGMAADALEIGRFGPVDDRRWMVVDPDGRLVTQREIPRLCHVSARPEPAHLPHRPRVPVARGPAPAPGAAIRQVTVWDDGGRRRSGQRGGNLVVGLPRPPLRLVYLPDDADRLTDPDYDPDPTPVSYADGYPLLLASTASLADLNARLPAPVPMARFRPNVVVSGIGPFGEDEWRELRIRRLRFSAVKPCARCSMTTVDPEPLPPAPNRSGRSPPSGNAGRRCCSASTWSTGATA
ncbi:MAG: MOSC domain-containing protein [Gemmatimonadales bacterium]